MLSEIFLLFKRKTWQIFTCSTFLYFVFLYSLEFFKFHSVKLYLKQRFGRYKVLFLNKRLHTTTYDSIKVCLGVPSPSNDSVNWKPLVKSPIPKVIMEEWLISWENKVKESMGRGTEWNLKKGVPNAVGIDKNEELVPLCQLWCHSILKLGPFKKFRQWKYILQILWMIWTMDT